MATIRKIVHSIIAKRQNKRQKAYDAKLERMRAEDEYQDPANWGCC